MQHYKLIKFIALILLDKNDNFKNYYSFNRVMEWRFKVFPITEFRQKLIDEGLIEFENDGIYRITSFGEKHLKDNFEECKKMVFETFVDEAQFLHALFEGYHH